MNGTLSDKPITLGERIKLMRESQGKSQHDVSMMSGLPVGYLSNIETGRIENPGADKLAIIARALDCTPNDLLGFTVEGAA